MNINDIIELNNNFYKSNAEEFSKTRQGFWQGWYKLLPYLKIKNSNMLDIGCGNGRLFSFLAENLAYEFRYTGVDINDYLINKAKERSPKAQFKVLDIFANLKDLHEKFDYIFIFGVMHHIPEASFRLKWLIKVADKLNINGHIFLTTWQLNNDLRSKKLVRLEGGNTNDFLYGWSNTNTQRYVHIYADDEIEKLVDKAKKLKIIDQYSEDGKNNKLNKYYVITTI